MASGDIVQRLFTAYAKGDSSAFRSAAQDFIAEEKRKNHHVLARELERILATAASPNGSNGKSQPQFELLTAITTNGAGLPHDRERSAVLVEIRAAQRDVDEMVFSEETRAALNRIVQENRRGEVLRSHGLHPANRILFCGPPGCGKTAAAEALAKVLYLPLVLVRLDAVVSSYLGDTAANLRRVFDYARTQPMVLLLDEFDAIGKRRDDEEEHGELKRVVNSFLQMLDGFLAETLVIAATNHQTMLDSAIWRRFDEVVFFDCPGPQAIEEVMRRNLEQWKLSPAVHLSSYAKALRGASHADAERVALEAIKQTILQDRARIEADVLESAVTHWNQRVAIVEQTNGQHPSPHTTCVPLPTRKSSPSSGKVK
jgi:SpoVK/Ycf46/Vps4 family AAA+-type ATPase